MNISNAFLLLGSNLGDKLFFLTEAKKELQQNVGMILNESGLYRTEAWGVTDQPSYLNQVVKIRCHFSPEILLEQILLIEKKLGRERKALWDARTIDIDILYIDQMVLQTPSLTIPHPRLHLRRFALVPMCEVAPRFVHPVFQLTQAALLERCPDNLSVELLTEQKNL